VIDGKRVMEADEASRREQLEGARDKALARRDKLDEAARAGLPQALLGELASAEAAVEPPLGEPLPEGWDDEAVERAQQAVGAYDRKLCEALDLAAQLAAQAAHDELPARTRTGRKVLGVIAAAAAVTLALTWLPKKLIDSAVDAKKACFEALDERGDAADCSQGGKLFWPKLVPWHRERALRVERGIEHSVAARALTQVVAVRTDAAQRDVLARQLGTDADALANTLWTLKDAGAFEVMAGLSSYGREVWPLNAAVTMGDRERVLAWAGRPSLDAHAYEVNLRRGAWLCLLGETKQGVEALALADAQYGAKVSGGGWLQARAAGVACGAGEAELDARLVVSFGVEAMRRVRLLDPAWQAGHRLAVIDRLLSKTEYQSDSDRMAAVALAIAGREYSLPDLLTLVASNRRAPLSLALDEITTPYSALAARELQNEVVSPDWLEAAARKLEATAASAPPKLEVDPERVIGPSDAAAADPPRTLRRAARLMWLRAARIAVGNGWNERARAALARADAAADSGAAWLSAPLHIAAGQAAVAERLLAPVVSAADFAQQTPLDRSLALLGHAWALTELGQLDEALAAAKAAHAATGDLDKAMDADSSAMFARLGVAPFGDASKLRERTAWFLAALLLRTGKVEPIDGLPDAPATLPDFAFDAPFETIAGYLHIARLSEAQRAAERGRAPHYVNIGASFQVLPAVFYVLGQAAAGADVEVWLDHLLARLHLDVSSSYTTRALLMARADAARWRGDEEAAKKWQARAAFLYSVIKDDRAAVVAQAAGL
jgi:hypothetical protein